MMFFIHYNGESIAIRKSARTAINLIKRKGLRDDDDNVLRLFDETGVEYDIETGKPLFQYRLMCKRAGDSSYREWEFYESVEKATEKGDELLVNSWITAYRVMLKNKKITEKKNE